MKACVDCAHYYEPYGSACDRPELREDHPIYGQVDSFPWGNRQRGGKCGPEAKYFAAKPPRLSRIARFFGVSP